ncbi:MAG: hypothetical protein R3284_04145 [Rubricoccaceae bacterium]|nr:hypothetical protein [Rubricoccaceae bacterium]
MPEKAPSKIYGLHLLKAGVAISIVLAIGLLTWLIDKALDNPDVQTKSPDWLVNAGGFSTSFWVPLIATVGVGIGLVLFVFLRAAKRIREGEDIYANRLGRNVRRRGERHIHQTEEQL